VIIQIPPVIIQIPPVILRYDQIINMRTVRWMLELSD
jgi:hypothetical protein